MWRICFILLHNAPRLFAASLSAFFSCVRLVNAELIQEPRRQMWKKVHRCSNCTENYQFPPIDHSLSLYTFLPLCQSRKKGRPVSLCTGLFLSFPPLPPTNMCRCPTLTQTQTHTHTHTHTHTRAYTVQSGELLISQERRHFWKLWIISQRCIRKYQFLCSQIWYLCINIGQALNAKCLLCLYRGGSSVLTNVASVDHVWLQCPQHPKIIQAGSRTRMNHWQFKEMYFNYWTT